MTRERLMGVALLLLTAAGVTGGMAYAWSQREAGSRGRDNCPADVKASTAVLVDITDPFTPAQRETVQQVIDGIAIGIGIDARLSLHVNTGNAEEAATPWKGFRFCKRHDPRQVNALTQTERFVMKDYEATFGRPLSAALDGLLRGGRAAQSPILEAIEAAAWGPVRADRIVVVSDLLQHSEISHLGAGLPDVCAVAASPLGVRLKARLAGRTVVLHQLRNTKHFARQTPQHRQWWSRLLYELEVAEVHDGTRLVARPAHTCSAAPAPRKARR